MDNSTQYEWLFRPQSSLGGRYAAVLDDDLVLTIGDLDGDSMSVPLRQITPLKRLIERFDVALAVLGVIP